jgi:hypothetical protein
VSGRGGECVLLPGCALIRSYSCQLLGQAQSGASCLTIGGDGAAGTYGDLSYCSPAIKLNYAMSAYYEYNPVASSCDFSGNATLAQNRESLTRIHLTLHLAVRQHCVAPSPSPTHTKN